MVITNVYNKWAKIVHDYKNYYKEEIEHRKQSMRKLQQRDQFT